MFQDLLRDVRHSLRLLRSSPTFTLVAIVTLALGIGANTAIFSVVHGLLLRPLPYSEPDRLLFVDGVLTRPEGEVRFQISYPDIEAIRTQAKSITGLAAWNTAWGLALEGTDGARRLEASFVGRGYFQLLGASPQLGRVFNEGDHAIGGTPALVAVISDATWRQEFGADPAIVGKEVRLQNRVFTVIGVMPASFTDVAVSQGSRVDVWSPIERAPELFGVLNFNDHATRLMWAVARLAPGASVAGANAELQTIGAQIAAAFPATSTNFSYRAASLSSQYFADARRPLWLLLGGSIFVLLIGCANVANLLLVRASDRSREFAVRLAIGASIGRVVRQLLVESLVLSMAGAITGLVIASWLTPALVRLSAITVPAHTPGWDRYHRPGRHVHHRSGLRIDVRPRAGLARPQDQRPGDDGVRARGARVGGGALARRRRADRRIRADRVRAADAAKLRGVDANRFAVPIGSLPDGPSRIAAGSLRDTGRALARG